VANPPDPAGQGRPGIDFDGDGIRDIILCVESNGQGGFQTTECANKNMKDVFVEFDSMAQHAAITAQITQVVTAFLNAPVANPNNNPNGIKLRIQIGDQNIPHINDVGFPPCTPAAPAGQNFDDLKKLWFGTAAERPAANDSAATLLAKEKTRSAKKLAFRYGISVHNLARAAGASPSGCAEVPGNDFIVALGSFGSGVHRNGVGPQDYWAGTLMHELGHTLGLRHGGFDNINCKPNYLSIMSYTRQFKLTISDRPLDYSRQEFDPLDEAAGLSEPAGIAGTPAQPILQGPGAPTPRTVHGPGTAKLPVATGGINWNSPTAPSNEPNVLIDVNNISNVAGCDGKGEEGQQLTLLTGYDDWANLVYDFRATLDFADGSYSSADEIREITEPEAKALGEGADANGDGFPDTASCGGAFCQIDIVPGLAGNKVILVQHQGTTKTIVSVAVLSLPGFDAAQTVNPASLKFAGARVSTILGKPACTRLDVNRDNRRDLVCTFTVLGLSPGEQTAFLEGFTLGATPVGIRAEGTMTAVLLFGGHDD
jgi:hypothetical protein